MALTKRGNMIYKYFQMHPTQHPTAEEVYNYVKTMDSKVGIATIYRNLNRLVELRYLREINLEKQGVRYDLNDEEHCHFICDACGHIENIQLDGFNDMNTIVEKITQGNVTKTNFMFHGCCRKCIK